VEKWKLLQDSIDSLFSSSRFRFIRAKIEENVEEVARSAEADGAVVDRQALREMIERDMPLKTRLFWPLAYCRSSLIDHGSSREDSEFAPRRR
jgi:hypothetical protein